MNNVVVICWWKYRSGSSILFSDFSLVWFSSVIRCVIAASMISERGTNGFSEHAQFFINFGNQIWIFRMIFHYQTLPVVHGTTSTEIAHSREVWKFAISINQLSDKWKALTCEKEQNKSDQNVRPDEVRFYYCWYIHKLFYIANIPRIDEIEKGSDFFDGWCLVFDHVISYNCRFHFGRGNSFDYLSYCQRFVL